MKVLIIPDAHAHPDYDNERFDSLGRLVSVERPDLLLCLGDFADLPSLGAYEKGKGSFEGRRLSADLDAAGDAMKRLLKPIKSRKAYSPRKVMLLGNHEERLDRAANDAAEYEGTIGTHLLPYQEWETKKFKVPFSFGGFVACHYFPSGDMGRPIGGVNVARALLQKGHQSCVVGHNHRLDVATDTRFDGRKVTSISAGCLTHPDSKEGWNISTEPLYWRGVVILNGVKNGDYRSMSLISYQEFA